MARRDDDDWLRDEQPLGAGLVAELQRLKRRAQARWLPVVLVAIALTVAILYKKSTKSKMKRAQVIMAVTEGTMGDGSVPMPVEELRDYVGGVLLSNETLLELIEEEKLFVDERQTLGDEYAVQELRDMFGIGVFRNYFLYEYSRDAPRSARIAVVVTAPKGAFAEHLAHRLAETIKLAEQRHRFALGDALAADARTALTVLRDRTAELDDQVGDRRLAMSSAEDVGDTGRAAALKLELAELTAKRRNAHEHMLQLTTLASADEQAAAIDRAGLGMTFEIAEVHRDPDEPGARLYFRIIQGAILFFMILPLVSIVVGAFDPRVHDREDVERVGLPVLGHLPSFPGDRVGSLRARGVRGRRVPS